MEAYRRIEDMIQVGQLSSCGVEGWYLFKNRVKHKISRISLISMIRATREDHTCFTICLRVNEFFTGKKYSSKIRVYAVII